LCLQTIPFERLRCKRVSEDEYKGWSVTFVLDLNKNKTYLSQFKISLLVVDIKAASFDFVPASQ
jgi:hypothetical protein